jgi:hypothetical protein
MITREEEKHNRVAFIALCLGLIDFSHYLNDSIHESFFSLTRNLEHQRGMLINDLSRSRKVINPVDFYNRLKEVGEKEKSWMDAYRKIFVEEDCSIPISNDSSKEIDDYINQTKDDFIETWLDKGEDIEFLSEWILGEID